MDFSYFIDNTRHYTPLSEHRLEQRRPQSGATDEFIVGVHQKRASKIDAGYVEDLVDWRFASIAIDLVVAAKLLLAESSVKNYICEC